MSQIQTDSGRLTLSLSALRNMDQFSHAPIEFTNLASVKKEEDDLSSQDNYSLCSSTHTHGHPWSLSDGDVDAGAVSSSKPESPEVQMLSFNLSQQLVPPSTVGPSEVMYQPGADFQVFQDNDMDFSQSRGDFNAYSAFLDFSALDNDTSVHNGSQSCTDDSLSVGQSSHTDDGHMTAANDAWNSMLGDARNYHRTSLDGLPSSIFQTVPVSPPLTEASNDFSVTSSCSQAGYPSFMTHEGAMLKDVTATPSLSSHGINLGDPLYPLSPPPLNEQDPKRFVLFLRSRVFMSLI